MQKALAIVLITLFVSCGFRELYSTLNNPIATQYLVRIELINPYIPESNQEHKIFEIKEPQNVIAYAKKLNRARKDGAWKGAHNLRLNLIYSTDTIQYIVFDTENNRVFKSGHSAICFTLPKPIK